MMRNRTLRRLLAGCAMLTSLLPAGAGVIDVTWDGSAGDSSWMTGDNWTPAMVPDNDNENTFRVFTNNAFIELGQTVEIDELTLNQGGGGGSVIDLGLGGQLNVLGPVAVDLGGFQGGTLTAEGPIHVNRQLNLDATLVNAPGGVNLAVGAANAGMSLTVGSILNNEGTLTILRDSSISGDAASVIQSSGTILKSGTTGQASIFPVLVSDQQGVIQSSTGTLAIGNANLSSTQLLADDGAILRFGLSGGQTEASGGVTVDTKTSGTVEFSGGALTLNGRIDGFGAGDFRFSNNVRVTGGGTIDVPVEMAATFAGATIGDPQAPMTTIHNGGDMALNDVVITGGGLQNDIDGVLAIPAGQFGEPRIAGGKLTNEGLVTQADLIRIDAGGEIVNNRGWDAATGSIAMTPTGQTGRFVNTGTFKLDGLTLFPTFVVTAPFQGMPGSVIQVDLGDMRIGGDDPETTKLTETLIVVDGARNANNFFSLGINGTSASTLEDVGFSLANAGRARILGGLHEAKGSLTSAGSGRVELGAASLVALEPLSLRFDAGAPLLLNSGTGSLLCGGTVQNHNQLNSSSGAIIGAGELRNRPGATIDVIDLLRISRGVNGNLRNRGSVLISGSNFEGITIDAGGQLLNDPNGIVNITGDADIARQPFGGAGDVINKGLIRKSSGNGESLITTAIYRQMNDGGLRCESGSMSVFADVVELLDGRLEPQGTGAKIRFPGSTLIQNVDCKFTGDATAEFQGSGTVLHELVGTFAGTGAGAAVHTGGTMAPRDALAILEFGSDPNNAGGGTAEFRQANGTLGQAGTELVNRGNVRMTGGTLLGTFSNTGPNGTFTLEGGTVGGTFLNNGAMTWEGGTIDAQVTNDETIEITADDNVLLASGAKITNNDAITHSGQGDVELGQNSEIVNQSAGELIFTDGANLVRPSSAVTGARLTNNGGTVANRGAANVSINVLFESTGGLIDAEDGALNINGIIGETGGEPRITGGTLGSTAESTPLVTRSALLRGGISHDLGSSGLVEHRLANIDATLTATGPGTVRMVGVTADGAAMQLVAASDATFEFSGTNNVGVAAASNGGEVRFASTTFNLFAGDTAGSFDASSDLEFTKPTATLNRLSGLDSGDRAILTSRQTARQVSGEILFSGAVQFDNVGTYDLTIDSGMSFTGGSNDILFNNSGTFCKSGGLRASFSTILIPFRNTGTVRVKRGNLNINPCTSLSGGNLTEGTWVVDPNTALELNGGTTITENDGVIRVIGNGNFKNLPTGATTSAFQNDGTLCLENGATFVTSGEFENNGTVKVSAGSTLSVGLLDNDSSLEVDGTLTFAGEARFQSGTLGGTGVVNGSTLSNGGSTKPGKSPGVLTINADFEQTATAALEIELAGTTVGDEYDRLVVNGPLTLDGTLELVLLDGYAPDPNDVFTVVTADSMAGSFANAVPGAGGTAQVEFADGTFDVLYSATAITLRNFQPAADCPGDIDGDNDVDISDLASLLAAFGSFAGDPAYNPDTDFDGDGDVDLTDLSTVLVLFGTTCP